MQQKPKPCKSTKTKDFGCGELSDKRTLGVCPKCYPKWLYSTDEGLEKVSKATIPVVRKRKEYEDAAKEITDRKKLSYLLVNTRNVLHEYIRLRDKGKDCCACGCLYKPNFQASHFYSASSFSTLKFNENNIHGCCEKCNLYNEGNIENFRIGLEARYGKDYVSELDLLAKDDKLNVKKWDRQELEAIRTTFRNKLKQLKNDKRANV